MIFCITATMAVATRDQKLIEETAKQRKYIVQYGRGKFLSSPSIIGKRSIKLS